MMSLSVIDFAACMIYLKINYLLWRKCLLGVEGGRGGLDVAKEVMDVGGGDGSGVYELVANYYDAG